MPGLKQLRIQTGFVAQEQQTFRIRIESTQGVNASRQAEISQRSPARDWLGCELREHTVGFVKRQQHAVSDERHAISDKEKAGHLQNGVSLVTCDSLLCVLSKSMGSTNSR